MKEIRAYLHKNRIADVLAAIEQSGLTATSVRPGVVNINVTAVQSLLKAIDKAEQRFSVELGEAVIEEVRLELLCEDHQVDAVVACIGRAGRTGQRVAGYVCVADVALVVAIGGPHP